MLSSILLDTHRIRHKQLRRFAEGKSHKIDARWVGKLTRMLKALHVITSPEELTFYRARQLTGNRSGVWSLHVSANWRLTFRWDENGPYEIDLEDYHG